MFVSIICAVKGKLLAEETRQLIVEHLTRKPAESGCFYPLKPNINMLTRRIYLTVKSSDLWLVIISSILMVFVFDSGVI